MADLDSLKKDVFFQLLALGGRVFVQVRFSPDVVIGKRGFVDAERKDGIVLVINSKMKFQWDDYGISVTLAFGATNEKCHIPAKDIVAVYSPELGAQFVTTPEDDRPDNKKRNANITQEDGNVIKVDFTQKG